MPLQICIFTWNTQTVRYGSVGGPPTDFVCDLSEKIINSEGSVDIAVVGLQEDSIRDSPILTELTNNLADHFELLKLTTLSGWGSTTYKALKNEWSYLPRGLRLAIYKRKALDMYIEVDTLDMVCPSVCDWITCGKGGLAINLTTSMGKLCFLNMHLPFNSESILNDRHDAVMWQAKCFRTLYDNAVEKYSPDYMFVLGDLNFRVQKRSNSGALEIAAKLISEPEYISELVNGADELRLLFNYSKGFERGPVPVMKEGPNDEGPTFLPTCKLRQGRTPNQCENAQIFLLGSKDHRIPSWCDRILYEGFKSPVTCSSYNRWERGSMCFSDHCAVIGTYII